MELSTLGLLCYKVEIPTHLFWCVIARRRSRRGNLKTNARNDGVFKPKVENSEKYCR